MKKEVIKGLIAISALLGFGFTPPSGNTTVMVNQSDVLVAPTATELINANPEFSDFFKVKGWQVNIDTTPSINPIDGYQTQLKTLQINTPYIDISDVLLKKLNRGELFFDANSLASQTNSITSLPFSVCATFDKADFDAISSSNPEYLFSNTSNVGGNAVSGAYAILKGTDGKTRLYVYKTNTLSSRIVEFDISNFVKSGANTIIFTASLQDNGVPYLKCFLNGNLVASRNNTAAWTDGVMTPDANFAWHQRNWLNPGNSSYVSQNNMRYSRLKAFNFDMSAAGAPYTVADYTAGIDEPPALHDTTATSRALLSLADYTLNGQILDASGNANNATVSGKVAGTHDAEIGALYKAFTGTDATVSSSGYVPTVQSFQDALRAALNSDGTAYTNTYQYEDDITVLTEWTDGEFKVLDENGDLIYWVSTQWGAQMGGDYTTNDATDLNAKIFYTCPENEVNGTGKGREWIEYVHDDVSARTIYEHAQGITGSATPTIGGIIIQPNFSGTTVGGTSIQSIFGKNVLDAPSGYQFIYLKASPTNLEKTKTAYPIWRTIRPIPVQGGN